ncbi:MAG: response regulator [Pseudoflavonifractor sp.]
MGLYQIMVVDDEAEARQGIVRKIDWNALGFQIVAEAENGRDALEKAESLDLDVVLTDIKMPFMDGLELGAELARRKPTVKLIVLSGFDEFEFAKQAIKLNVVEYVLKPVNAEELSGILRRVKALLDAEIAQRRNIDRLNEAYQKSMPLLREKFLQDLMRGPMPAEELAGQAARFGLSIVEGEYKVVAVCNIDICNECKPDIAPELVPVSIRQMLDDELRGRCRREIFSSLSSVILVTAWDHDPIEELMSLLSQICAECPRILNVTMTAGIGRTKAALENIYESYAEARTALEYNVLAGAGRAIYIQDMEQSGGTAEEYDRQDRQLLSAIKFGTREQIAAQLDLLLEKDGDGWSPQARLMGVMGTLMPIIQRYKLGEQEMLGDRESWLRLMEDETPPETVRVWLLEVCQRMSGCFDRQRISTTKRLVEEAESYLREHYRESDLSVDRLCGYLHISQSYFSTIFKQETHQSYVQYLTDLRMERAMELLRTTDDKTYLIAQQVGYDEPNYFGYVFKKKFGVSPSQYRK